MSNAKIKMMMSLVVMTVILGLGQAAEAKKKGSRAARAYSYFDDGKQSQEQCDPEKKAPRKLKTRKGFQKGSGYLGSEFIEAGDSEKGTPEAWKHYFSTSGACNEALAKHKQ